MQQLRELVLQLKADNERLRQEQVAATAATTSSVTAPLEIPANTGTSSASNVSVTERLVYIPRDRKCPMFRGKSGIGIDEWVEEVQACMRARHLSLADQAFFLFDHLEGEAREEIKYRSSAERGDPAKVIAVLQEIYGCSQSYVALQEAFFSRKQQDGETLQEFSLALLNLMERVKQSAPTGMPNAEALLRDQFIEHVAECALRRELKQLVRCRPAITLLEVRSEAIRWEQEGMLGGIRARSQSVPAYGIQYGVQGGTQAEAGVVTGSELGELKDILKRQQDQLDKLVQTVASLQESHRSRPPQMGRVVCRRCQRPGHFARECREAGISHAPSVPGRGPSFNLRGPSRSNQVSEN